MNADGAARSGRWFAVGAWTAAALMCALLALDVAFAGINCLGGTLAIIVLGVPLVAHTMWLVADIFPIRMYKSYAPAWSRVPLAIAYTAYDAVALPAAVAAAVAWPEYAPRPTFDARRLQVQALLYAGVAALTCGTVADRVWAAVADDEVCFWLPLADVLVAADLVLCGLIYLRRPASNATHETVLPTVIGLDEG